MTRQAKKVPGGILTGGVEPPRFPHLARHDPAQLGQALAAAGAAVARNPLKATSPTGRWGLRLWKTGTATLNRLAGRPAEGPMPADPRDKRFADPAWEQNAVYWGLRQVHLAWRQYGLDLLEVAGLDRTRASKAELALSMLQDAMAPTNFPMTNPAVLKRAFDTGGRSLAVGWRTFADDLRHNHGRPRQVDTTPFAIGHNLACTPAKVVYRNHLVEVLQYLPQTGEVSAVPLLCSPPWINKYYVMDLAPERSFIEWAVRHGRTVFVLSYRNPGASMAHTTLDDYLVLGPRKAMDVICDITGASKVDFAGLCLGGTLAVMTAAYLRRESDDRLGTITLLNTLVDFSEPGVLGRFTDPPTVARMERRTRSGYLPARDMTAVFDFLRPNDLIFPYVVSNWLMGLQPPAFDILAWNADATRMPAAMYSQYLRELYVGNNLVRGKLAVRGRALDLRDVDQEVYVVSAVNDHIVPWTSSYATLGHLRGDSRFVLSSGGHIAGIVNPPSAKAWYLTGEQHPGDPLRWRENANRHAGSWWDDWARWGAKRAGEPTSPPPIGSENYPVLCDGPGEFVQS
jgi:polyhydroxyalkanoate synthase